VRVSQGGEELTHWYIATALPEVASIVAQRGEITDEHTFREWWSTAPKSVRWRKALDDTVERCSASTVAITSISPAQRRLSARCLFPKSTAHEWCCSLEALRGVGINRERSWRL
jgi:hypothetical protein